jgi:hypothetical protein
LSQFKAPRKREYHESAGGDSYHLSSARARNDLLCPGGFYIFHPNGVLVLSDRLFRKGRLIHPWEIRRIYLLPSIWRIQTTEGRRPNDCIIKG